DRNVTGVQTCALPIFGITNKMAGITTVTLVVVVITGILTSVLGPVLLKYLHITDPVAVGLSLGGTGHAIGTGTALKYGYVEGAKIGRASWRDRVKVGA